MSSECFAFTKLTVLVGWTLSLKLASYQRLIAKLPSAVKLSYAGKTNLSLFLGGVFLLFLSDGLSVSTGGYVDVSELIALSDGFFVECLGVSLFSLLLVNPQIIKQFWRLISFIFKLTKKLNSSHLLSDLSVPSLQSLAQDAHGCRAPPF
jgi:hypothetical protein